MNPHSWMIRFFAIVVAALLVVAPDTSAFPEKNGKKAGSKKSGGKKKSSGKKGGGKKKNGEKKGSAKKGGGVKKGGEKKGSAKKSSGGKKGGKKGGSAKKGSGKKKADTKNSAKKSGAKKGGSAKKKDGLKRDAAKKDGGKKDAIKKGAGKKDSGSRNAAKKDRAKKDPGRKDSAKKDRAKKDAGKKDSAKKDSARKDAAKKDSARKDAARKDAPRNDRGRQQDEWRHHHDRQRDERRALTNLSHALSNKLTATSASFASAYAGYRTATARPASTTVNVASTDVSNTWNRVGFTGVTNRTAVTGLTTGATAAGFNDPALPAAVSATLGTKSLTDAQRDSLVKYRNYLLGSNLAAAQKSVQLAAVQDCLVQDAQLLRGAGFNEALVAGIPAANIVVRSPAVAGINPAVPACVVPAADGETTTAVCQSSPGIVKVEPDNTDTDPLAAALIDDRADVPQTTRSVRVANNTDQPLTVHLRYHTESAGANWAWFPEEGKPAVKVVVAPGKVVDLKDGDWLVNADRIYIWGEGAGKSWSTYKSNPLVLVPEVDQDGKHTYLAPVRDVFTYTFQ